MIIVRLQGGLGNQMFQYAFGKAYSILNNVELKFDITHLTAKYRSKRKIFRTYDLDIFDLDIKLAKKSEILKYTIPRINNKYIYHTLNFIYKSKNFIEEKTPFNFNDYYLKLGDNKYFSGYWQSYKYFSIINNFLKEKFRIKYTIQQNSEYLLQKIQESNSICLNYRRTDYINDKLLNTLVGEKGREYYNNAINYITSKVTNPIFFVFSDDIEWCKKNVNLDFEKVFVEHEHSGIKYSNYFLLMYNCKHFIIPNSTFAWWAAWLSENENKIVIAPKRWVNFGSFNPDDLFPVEWYII